MPIEQPFNGEPYFQAARRWIREAANRSETFRRFTMGEWPMPPRRNPSEDVRAVQDEINEIHSSRADALRYGMMPPLPSLTDENNWFLAEHDDNGVRMTPVDPRGEYTTSDGTTALVVPPAESANGTTELTLAQLEAARRTIDQAHERMQHATARERALAEYTVSPSEAERIAREMGRVTTERVPGARRAFREAFLEDPIRRAQTGVRVMRKVIVVTRQELESFETVETYRRKIATMLLPTISLAKQYTFRTYGGLSQANQRLTFFQKSDARCWHEGEIRPLDRWLTGVFRGRVEIPRVPEFIFVGEET